MLAKAYDGAEAKYETYCPTSGDAESVRIHLSRCSDDLLASMQPGGGPMPDYVAQVAACGQSLSTCTVERNSCAASLSVAIAGSASAGEVLLGRTFTSAAGIAVAGTMPNVGSLAIVPGAVVLGIPAGFHDGSGTVGRATAGNYLLQTGQTTTYGANSDGAMRRGEARDWRIPNLEELESLRNLEGAGLATFAAFDAGCASGGSAASCSCTRPNPYWTSSSSRGYPGYAWYVFFNQGYVDFGNNAFAYPARAVRGGSPPG